MKVTLVQRGGLAAAINLNRPPRVVDTAMLSADEAAELRRLIGDAVTMPATDSGAQKARDAMSYKIMVEDGGQETVLSQSDASMSEAFATLLAWLQRRAT